MVVFLSCFFSQICLFMAQYFYFFEANSFTFTSFSVRGYDIWGKFLFSAKKSYILWYIFKKRFAQTKVREPLLFITLSLHWLCLKIFQEKKYRWHDGRKFFYIFDFQHFTITYHLFPFHLSATLPRCARVLTGNLVFCSWSNSFQLQMQASQPHFQLELCTPQLGKNLPLSVVRI
jgi:hypothetical protein